MSLLFFSNERAFSMLFYVPFHFFQLPLDFVCRPKAAFCKDKVHRGTPKGVKMSVKMSVPFFLNQMAFLHVFLRVILFFQSFSILLPLQNQHFASLECVRGPQKEEKCQFSFSLMKRHFLMHFYVPFHFFKVFFNFASIAKAAFCKFTVRRVPQKEGKCHFSFSLMKRHFFMHFYVPFHFFKVSLDFACRPKAAFCKPKVHRGTPKGVKMSFPFFLNQIAFLHVFLRAILFFQSLFQFCFRCKCTILQV